MKKLSINIRYLFTVITISTLLSCETKQDKVQDQSSTHCVSDYTEELFTAGIEGPELDNKGNLYVVNYQLEGSIGCITADGTHSLFVQLPQGSIGNGLKFSNDYSILYVADYAQHNILSVDMNTREIAVFAHQDTMINQPNDIAITKNDMLYATDPNWQDNSGKLWRVEQGRFVLLEDNMGTTNGIAVSPDQKFLYVNESIQRKIWKFKLDDKGNIINKTLFIEFPDFGLDGMRCDQNGNLYITRYGKGTIVILSPNGDLLHEIALKGKTPTNIAFGRDILDQLYITLQDRKLVEKVSFVCD